MRRERRDPLDTIDRGWVIVEFSRLQDGTTFAWAGDAWHKRDRSTAVAYEGGTARTFAADARVRVTPQVAARPGPDYAARDAMVNDPLFPLSQIPTKQIVADLLRAHAGQPTVHNLSDVLAAWETWVLPD